MTSPSTTTNILSHSRCPRSHAALTCEGGFSHGEPTIATDGHSWSGTNVHGIVDQIDEEDPHEFRPPGEEDSRSPCPALNTLANHGYLPRNGRNITRDDLLAALENPDTYHLSKPLAGVLVHGGFVLMRETEKHSISLYELARHNRIEHSASVVHKNTTTGCQFAPTRCNTKLLDGLLNNDFLTSEMVQKRRVELEKVSPLDPVHQEIARGEWALVLDVFGREHGGKIPSDFLRVWLQKNQFPEGWKPTHEQGLLATAWKSRDIRLGMERYRKDHEYSLEDCLLEMTLKDQLTSMSPTSKIGEGWGSQSIPMPLSVGE